MINIILRKGLGDLNHRKKYNFEYPNGQPIHLDGDQALAIARARNAYGGYRGKIIDIELKKTGDDYAILCLIEYGNRERRWENEMSLEPVEEKE